MTTGWEPEPRTVPVELTPEPHAWASIEERLDDTMRTRIHDLFGTAGAWVRQQLDDE